MGVRSPVWVAARVAMVVAALVHFAALGEAAQPVEFVVVVNAANRLESHPAAQIAAFFLKKSSRWPDGSEVKPFDRAGDNAIRTAFTREVLGKEPDQVRSYWQQQIFSGRAVPPTELPSDKEILEAVGAHPGAVGYASAGTPLGSGVRVLRISR